jgi:N-acetylglucosaminyldiphosphoundecaprenol N-acetyl-beta-D-mannosaminyltransferase
LESQGFGKSNHIKTIPEENLMQRCYLAKIPVDSGPRRETWEMIINWLYNGGKSRQVVTLNAVMLISALKNNRLKEVIQRSDLVSVDGYGILLALKKKGLRTERFPGVELADRLLSYCVQKRLSVYCYGGSKESARRLWEKHCNNKSVIFRAGFGERDDLIQKEIISLQPALLLAGLGSPRQELFLAKLLPKLKATVGIGVGGAFEILSGLKPRAPAILSNHGWEWGYRMFHEPQKIKHLPELAEFWLRFLR